MGLPGIEKYGYPSGSNNANGTSHNNLQALNKTQNEINNSGGKRILRKYLKNKKTFKKYQKYKFNKHSNKNKKTFKKYSKNKTNKYVKNKKKIYKPRKNKYQTIKYKNKYIKRGGNSGSMRVVVPQASTYGMTSTTPNNANASSVDISKTILQSNSNAQYDTDTNTNQYII